MIPLIRVQDSLESGNCTAKFPTKFLNQINFILTEVIGFWEVSLSLWKTGWSGC